MGDRVWFQKCDVSIWDDVLKVFEETYARFGIIHTVLSNAGITSEDLLDDKFDADGRLEPPNLKSLQVNLVGQLYTARCTVHFAKKWPETKTHLVMTASAAAFFASPPFFVYTAAKTGVLGLMRALHLDLSLGKKNLSVNAICPFFTSTCGCPPGFFES